MNTLRGDRPSRAMEDDSDEGDVTQADLAHEVTEGRIVSAVYCGILGEDVAASSSCPKNLLSLS